MTSYTEDYVETITDFISMIIEAPSGAKPLPIQFGRNVHGKRTPTLGTYEVTVREASS